MESIGEHIKRNDTNKVDNTNVYQQTNERYTQPSMAPEYKDLLQTK